MPGHWLWMDVPATANGNHYLPGQDQESVMSMGWNGCVSAREPGRDGKVIFQKGNGRYQEIEYREVDEEMP